MEVYGFENFREQYIAAGGTASSEAKNSLKVGGYISVMREFALSEKGLLRAGVKYWSTGDSYFFTTPDVEYQSSSGGSTDAKFKMRPRTDYLALPIQYGGRVSERITLYGGLTPAFNVNNIIRFNYFEGSGDDVDEKWDKFDNPVNARGMVVFVSTGLNYYMDSKWVLEFNVNKSLNSVYDDPNAVQIINDAKSWNFELGIGIALR